jgi:hypothetical protein
MSYRFEPAEFDRQEELLGDRRETAAPRSQRLRTVALALAVMAVFAAGLWFAYEAGTRHAAGAGAAPAPLIRADARPLMMKPAEPGGLKIPDRNMLIYDPGRRPTEHLLPPPEQPMARPTAAAAVVPAVAAAKAAASTPSAAGGEPPVAAPAKATALPKPAEPGHGVPPARPGNARLQLGSVKSASAARTEWSRIRQKNTDLLGAVSATPVRADLGDKGVFYRIETSPLGDQAASRICGALKQRKVGCIIVR